MARVRFITDFYWHPKPHTTIAYKAGREMTVTRECAALAVAAGKAVEVESRPRDEGNGDVSRRTS